VPWWRGSALPACQCPARSSSHSPTSCLSSTVGIAALRRSPPPCPTRLLRPWPVTVALTPSSPVAGSVYFITNDDARPFWGFLGDLVAPLGYPRPRVHLPLGLVLTLAAVVEFFLALLAPFGVRVETDFTRTRMILASCERRVSCGAARRDFGYVPEVGIDEAVRRTVAHYERLRAK